MKNRIPSSINLNNNKIMLIYMCVCVCVCVCVKASFVNNEDWNDNNDLILFVCFFFFNG